MALNAGSKTPTAIKICGITKTSQAQAIANLGVNAIGVIGVKNSPRYVSSDQRRKIFSSLAASTPSIKRVWVVANMTDQELFEWLNGEGLPTVVQLHGEETQTYCARLRKLFPEIEWWKAIRIKDQQDLKLLSAYKEFTDAFLLDSWAPDELGGTGKRLPFEWLKGFKIDHPWWLAGGICAECIKDIFNQVKPWGIDASSRLEISPGEKDLMLVENLIKEVLKFQVYN